MLVSIVNLYIIFILTQLFCYRCVSQLGYGSKGNKIHYSGPLVVPTGKMDQMMKDHDRQVQEAVRRARLDKAKLRKAQVEGNQLSINSLFVAGR